MGDIFNITNMNAYVGRYGHKAAADQTGWYVGPLFREKLPVASLRRRERDDLWPLSWRSQRSVWIAVETAALTLKAWQAFRPLAAEDVIPALHRMVPQVLVQLQGTLRNSKVLSINDLQPSRRKAYPECMAAIAGAVCAVSLCKTAAHPRPMLGSKMLHFLLPEFFPVWDTAWVERKALFREDLSDEALGEWMPPALGRALDADESGVAREYAVYMARMLMDLAVTDDTEYQRVERILITHAGVSEEVIRWHFADLAPFVFEMCLLGKHVGKT